MDQQTYDTITLPPAVVGDDKFLLKNIKGR